MRPWQKLDEVFKSTIGIEIWTTWIFKKFRLKVKLSKKFDKFNFYQIKVIRLYKIELHNYKSYENILFKAK